MPYHCLQRCGNILLAARGSNIDSFSLQVGSLLSTWDCLALEKDNLAQQNEAERTENISLSRSPPPAKRRRISPDPASGKDEELRDGRKRLNHRATSSGLSAPAVIALAATKNGRHVIAVTGEDKSIRVFENVSNSNGLGTQELRQLSQRAMPKRPCAIAIIEDDTTIICGDKFGDVYSLPLLPPEGITDTPDSNTMVSTPKSSNKPSLPAANSLTVHSQRNLRALENQKRHLGKPAERSGPEFEHNLLLGHVSMLTDIVLARQSSKTHIITSDRDEHIRVSRGTPQAHIIEGFCLGHTQFVSRLCIPATFPDMLISGGGDDDLFMWRWGSGQLLSKVDLNSHVEAVKRDLDVEVKSENSTQSPQLTVSAIVHSVEEMGDGVGDLVVVTCEGIPALFWFSLAADQLRYKRTTKLTGNPLAIVPVHLPNMAATKYQAGVIVSIDTVHRPGSTTLRRDDFEESGSALQFYTLSGDDNTNALQFQTHGNEATADEKNNYQHSSLLYSFGNLRKREGESHMK